MNRQIFFIGGDGRGSCVVRGDCRAIRSEWKHDADGAVVLDNSDSFAGLEKDESAGIYGAKGLA